MNYLQELADKYVELGDMFVLIVLICMLVLESSLLAMSAVSAKKMVKLRREETDAIDIRGVRRKESLELYQPEPKRIYLDSSSDFESSVTEDEFSSSYRL